MPGLFDKKDFVCVHRGTDPLEASLLRGLLESEGIPARTSGEELVGAYSGVPRLCDIRVLVPARYETPARGVLKAYEARAPGAAEWTCAGCGESNESTFEVCWSCGAARPDRPEA